MHPAFFGTVDQFAVKALRQIPEYSEVTELFRMNPESLGSMDAAVLIGIMRRKAVSLSTIMGMPWTPRMVDKVLWTYGRT